MTLKVPLTHTQCAFYLTVFKNAVMRTSPFYTITPTAAHKSCVTAFPPTREKQGGSMLPDAAHAPRLGSQLAPLQLGGDNLTLCLKFPGEALKLKLLRRERKQKACVKTERRKGSEGGEAVKSRTGAKEMK